MNMLFDLVSML